MSGTWPGKAGLSREHLTEVILGIIIEKEYCEQFCWLPEFDDSMGMLLIPGCRDIQPADVSR